MGTNASTPVESFRKQQKTVLHLKDLIREYKSNTTKNLLPDIYIKKQIRILDDIIDGLLDFKMNDIIKKLTIIRNRLHNNSNCVLLNSIFPNDDPQLNFDESTKLLTDAVSEFND